MQLISANNLTHISEHHIWKIRRHWPTGIAPEADVLKETKVCLLFSIISRILNSFLSYISALEKFVQNLCKPNCVKIARSSLDKQHISSPQSITFLQKRQLYRKCSIFDASFECLKTEEFFGIFTNSQLTITSYTFSYTKTQSYYTDLSSKKIDMKSNLL